MTTCSLPASAPAACPGLLSRFLAAIANRVGEWQDRAVQRAQLATMDDRMLKDIGISNVDALREASKPFWRV